MQIPESILQRLEENERVAQKFHELESSILNILNFQDFFENLLTKISQSFHVPHVWISVIGESPIASQILGMEDSNLLKSKTAFVSRRNFHALIGQTRRPLLANTGLTRFSPLLPLRSDCRLGSVAVAPISLDGVIIGSLNQGDEDPERFMPGIDTDLLERLALKISLCLSNVAAHERLKHLAFHDPLTGLLNRRVMEKMLEQEYERSKRYQSPLSVIFLDLDDFKGINDTFGHDQGDRALIHISRALTAEKRANDMVARFAGDEFVVILPSTIRTEAGNYIQRVQELLAKQAVNAERGSFHIRFSAGIASVPDPDISSSTALLKLADQQLYQVKQKKGPDRC
ncbi:MAG: sensor domain-containing diguanylate cyclase [Desulfobacteraceae bacterium]|nr:sensor domain-containing diguanylate cyclase [Desulfobacteraceae bacterium]